MSLEATSLVWAGSPHRAEHEPGNLGSDNQAVAELSAETHFQEENSRIANASSNYANLPIDRKHANFAAACVADVTPSTSGALTAATNWAEQMEASETDEDGFTVVKHKRRRRESPRRPVEQRSSGVATSRRTGPTPRRRPPAGGATGVQMIRATRADIADARACQRSSTEDNCVFVEHCPDFGSTHYLQAVEELVGGAGNVLQVMKMDGHMLVGLSTKALAERLIRDGLDIGHTHLRAFPFKKRAERITVGNLPFFVDDAAVIEALKPYGDVTSIVPIRLRAGRYTFMDGRREAFILLKEGIALEKIPTPVIIRNKGNVLSAFISYGVKCSRCGRQGHRRANCPIIPGRASNNAKPQPAPLPSGASSTESRQLNRPTPTAPAPSPKRPAPQTSAPGTSAALPARTSSDAVAPSSEPMEIAAEVLAPSTSTGFQFLLTSLRLSYAERKPPRKLKPMEAPEAPADLRPPASQPAGVVPQAQPASVAPPGPLHAHGTPVPPSPSSSGRKTRPDLEAYLKRNPGVSFAETNALGLGREEVLDILSSKTRAHKRGQHLTLPQSNALAGLIYQILDLRPGGDSNIYKVLRQVLSELRTAPTAVPSTPPLPAPRPAGPTPPVPHEEETTPTAMRPSPPLEPTIEDDLIVEIFTKLDHTTSLRPIYEAGINPVVLRNAVLYAEYGKPLMAKLTTALRKVLAEFLSAALELAQNYHPDKQFSNSSCEDQRYANPPTGVRDANLAAARGDVTTGSAAATSSNGAARVLGNWADYTEDPSPGADEDFTVIKSRKRRRNSADSPTAAKHHSNPRGAGANSRPRSSTGWVPRAEEIKTTRAHIAEARARQASSAEDNCVYVEYSPEFEPYHYIRAVDRMIGGTNNVFQVSKINGHYLMGLNNRGLAERLISEGLEVEGTLFRAFPFRKRAMKITVGNLPFFVEDSTIISALTPYGRVTSIAPKLMKAGPYIYNDGRRDAFIVLHEGVTTERLPTRLEIKIKGEVWPAYLSYGIRCSRCHGQGHRRANCPLLAGRANNSRLAPPTSPAGVPSTTTSAPPQRSAAQPPAPAPSSTAMEIPGASHAARAVTPSAAPRPSTPVASAVPMEMAPPAPPPVTPAPSLRAPGSHEPAAPTPDIEMSIVEETSTSSTSSSKTSTRESLVTFIERNPGVSFAQTDALGLGREEVLDILSSKTKARKRGPLLSPSQGGALAGLIRQLLGQRPGGDSNIYKVLRQVLSELRTAPTAVPSTPPLPAPRPAEPTPPAPQRRESASAMAAPPPPPSAHAKVDPVPDRWKVLKIRVKESMRGPFSNFVRVECVDKFRVYLLGTRFVIYSDHHALQWLKTIKDPTGRLFRWSLRLSAYDYEVKYLKGSRQYEADLLSRNPFCGFLSTGQIKDHQGELRRDTRYILNDKDLMTIIRRGVTKIIVPPSLRGTLLQRAHRDFNHPGISQMTRLIAAQYYWDGMTNDIRTHVRTCSVCQLVKPPKGPIYGELGQLPPAVLPYELVSLDTISGFAKYGNSQTFLHVVVDHATRYAWAFPSRSTSILTYTQVIKKVMQFGSPKRLLTDRAPAFTSPKFRRFLIRHNIGQLLTTSNNPQANGLSERLNATITGKLKLLRLQQPKTAWTKLLPQVLQAYNHTPHSVTGFPPSYLLLGSFPLQLSEHVQNYPKIDDARELAYQRTHERHLRDKARFDQTHRASDFEVGDLVLAKTYHHPDTGKLAPFFSGPYEILEIISPQIVRINRSNRPLSRETDTIHVNKLKHYTENEQFISPP
ncbi:hypothetical protein LAZ67_3002366, partial [Cordylochernes scorpioides]